MDRRRVALEVYDVWGMFRQAAVSFKASFPLFLTLALLSSVYETAVERSALLSGISFSAQNSNFSFQFALDPKSQAAQSSHNVLNTGGLKKFDTADSLLSRLLTALLPPDDQVLQHAGVKREEAASNVVEPKLAQISSPLPPINEGDVVHAQVPDDGKHIQDPSSIERLQAGVHKDEDHSNEVSDNGRELVQRNVDGDPIDELKSSHEEMGMELTEERLEHDHMKVEPVSKETVEESGFEDMFEKIEEDDTGHVTLLKFESVSNETKKLVQETVIDAIDLTFFTGRLLGGRGLDQGALPHGGLTMLLIFLLVAVAVTVFLAIVGFQHAAVLGSVAYSVVSTHMGKRASARQAIKSSLKSSIARLMWLAILHATLRGLQSLFFMKTLFGGVMEMEQVESLVLRLSAMPFAFLSPFMDADATNLGMAVRIGLFVGFDYLFDGVAYCIYMVACWVTILERNYWGLGAVTRSCNLVKSMERQALVVRLIEATICGRTSRWLLQQVIGQFAAASVICVAQVYFLVLWLIFYMSARSLHDQPSQFSHRTLEDFLDRFK
eukprot:c22590_g1_i1 orf=276-1931(+)